MKIVFITNLFPPHYVGGFEIRCAQVARALQARGHEVVVLTSRSGVEQPCVDGEGNSVHRLLDLYCPFTDPVTGETFGFSLDRRARWATTLANYRLAHTFLTRERPDVVFAWSQARLSVGAIRAVQDLKIPLAWTFGDPNIVQYRPARLKAKVPRLADYVSDRTRWRRATWTGLDFRYSHCVSLDIKRRLLARGLPIANAEVIYRGIPVEQFPVRDDLGGVQSPARILFVGQLHSHKGAHTLIDAAQRLAARRGAGYASVTIVGEGGDAYKHKLAAMATSGKASVAFRGKIPHPELSRVYREHDIFVFPSSGGGYEGFGATALEAMASGLPIVGTTAGGMAELFQHEANALVFTPEDAIDLAAKLERLIDNHALRARLAQTARAQVERDFNLAGYAQKMESFLYRAATGPNRRIHPRHGQPQSASDVGEDTVPAHQ